MATPPLPPAPTNGVTFPLKEMLPVIAVAKVVCGKAARATAPAPSSDSACLVFIVIFSFRFDVRFMFEPVVELFSIGCASDSATAISLRHRLCPIQGQRVPKVTSIRLGFFRKMQHANCIALCMNHRLSHDVLQVSAVKPNAVLRDNNG